MAAPFFLFGRFEARRTKALLHMFYRTHSVGAKSEG